MRIDAVREYARRACEDDRNLFGPSFFDEHLVWVADCALRLAAPLGADPVAVEAAAYLHDLSAVCDPATLPRHPEAGAALATRVLRELAWPEDVVARTAEAIARHSEPLAAGSDSPEAVCLSNADAAARILRPAYWLYFAFAVRKQSFEEGRRWLRSLLMRQWDVLIEPARELAANQYRITIELLS